MAAFALLCDACILHPVPRDAGVGFAALEAVRDPDRIHLKNWRRYTLEVLFLLTARAKRDCLANQTTFTIPVCVLLPQVTISNWHLSCVL